MEKKNLYFSMYGFLLARIHFKYYPEGEYLPSIHKLSELFGVSTMTVRGALKLLEQDGYISGAKNKRSVILSQSEDSHRELPNEIIVQEAVLEDLYKSLEIIFPNAVYYSLSLCSEEDILMQQQILDKPAYAWDEPTVHFLAQLIKRLHNSLLMDLYYDAMLFSYPSYLASLAKDQTRWQNVYHMLHDKLHNMLRMQEEGETDALRNLIEQVYQNFNPYSVSVDKETVHDRPYRWGKPHVCFSVASELIRRIYLENYPAGTFLPSARKLAEEFSIPIITVRRAIVLLNNLGVTESINGKGTRSLLPEEGVKQVKWSDPIVRKNIMSYLESLHVLALTCRSMAAACFSLIGKNERQRMKAEIIMAVNGNHYGVINYICTNALILASDRAALKTIYDQLFSLLIWGYPFSTLEPYLQMDDYANRLIQSLDDGDSSLFEDTLEQLITKIFLSSREKAVSVGIEEARVLTLPFCETQSVSNLL